jgi:hypothetical protein
MRESGTTGPFILNLRTRWRCVIRFIPQPLELRGKTHGRHWTGNCVDPGAGLELCKQRKISTTVPQSSSLNLVAIWTTSSRRKNWRKENEVRKIFSGRQVWDEMMHCQGIQREVWWRKRRKKSMFRKCKEGGGRRVHVFSRTSLHQVQYTIGWYTGLYSDVIQGTIGTALTQKYTPLHVFLYLPHS